MEFIKKYGGTRLSVPDNVPMRPVCPTCGKPMVRIQNEHYRCVLTCDQDYRAEQLKGLAWIPARGVR